MSSPVPSLASLSDWLRRLDRQVRDLATGNPLNKGSVQNAEGESVPLSSLAFGQAATTYAGVGVVALTGPLGVAGSSGWVYPAAPNLRVSVLVRGGRLRVDWASLLSVQSNANAAMVYSYAVMYTGPEDSPDTEWTMKVAPDYYRATVLNTPDGNGVLGAYGSFAFHEDLPTGWYRVCGCFRLDYSLTPATGQAPAGGADNPRIGATPF